MRTPGPAEDTELAALARVFLLGLVDDPEERREVLQVLHQRAVADHRSLPQVGIALENDHETGHYPRQVLGFGLTAGQGLIDWLAGLLSELVVIDAMSGVSGAGRKTEDRLLYGTVEGNLAAYGSGTHRHVPEMASPAAETAPCCSAIPTSKTRSGSVRRSPRRLVARAPPSVTLRPPVQTSTGPRIR
jgi:hypothetical protein